jgi:hypothetical protein
MVKTTFAAGVLATVALGFVAAPSASAAPEISRMSAAAPTQMVTTAPFIKAPAQATTACYRVTAYSLRIRKAPSNNAQTVGHLKRGQVVRASVKVTTGFRQLGPNRWSGAKYLAKVNTTGC